MQRINTDVRTFGLPLDGAQLVTPIKSSRKELNEPIELPVPSARTTTIVRTGCIPCLYGSHDTVRVLPS